MDPCDLCVLLSIGDGRFSGITVIKIVELNQVDSGINTIKTSRCHFHWRCLSINEEYIKAETDTTYDDFLKVYYIFRLAKPAFFRYNGTIPLYLNKAGLASRNIVHLQKIILRCVSFCFYIFFIHMWSRLDHYWSHVYQQDHRSGCVLKNYSH